MSNRKQDRLGQLVLSVHGRVLSCFRQGGAFIFCGPARKDGQGQVSNCCQEIRLQRACSSSNGVYFTSARINMSSPQESLTEEETPTVSHDVGVVRTPHFARNACRMSKRFTGTEGVPKFGGIGVSEDTSSNLKNY